MECMGAWHPASSLDTTQPTVRFAWIYVIHIKYEDYIMVQTTYSMRYMARYLDAVPANRNGGSLTPIRFFVSFPISS